ncbi:unnamed protein product, partial [Ectocarpus fasciculatus]
IDAEGDGVLSVLEQSGSGARVAVTHGAVTFTVYPNGTGRDLRVQAGPIEVRVTGTRFTVERDADTEEVWVTVERGSVAIHAPEKVWAIAAGDRWHWQPPTSMSRPLLPAPALTPLPEASEAT